MGSWADGEVIVNKRKIPCKIGKMPITELKFYAKNPRIYSRLWSNDGPEPDQVTIYAELKKHPKLRILKGAIARNGETRDPVIVLKETSEVLEGNRRLASYKWLAENQPADWNHIPVKVVSKLDEKTIFSILGFYHLTDQSLPWDPFERAGFVYREHIDNGKTVKVLNLETGLSQGMIRKDLKTYTFMTQQELTSPENWSHCEQLTHNPGIKRVTEVHPELESRIVKEIKQGRAPTAQDLRDKCGKLDKAPPKVQAKYAKGEIELEDAYRRMQDSGGDNPLYQKIKSFNDYYLDDDIMEELERASREATGKITQVVNKLNRRTKEVMVKLGMQGN